MADYPGTVTSFSTKVDYVDVIFADHVNKLQDEMLGVQNTLGNSILTSSGWSGAFNQVTATWGSVKARLNNIEYGLDKAYNNRVDTAGGSTITSSATTVVGLKFVAIASQTANLIEWKNSSNTTVSYVDKDGGVYTSSKQLVPIVYGSSQPSSVPVGTIWVDSATDVGTLNFQGVVPDGGTTGQVLSKVSNDDYDYDWEDVVIPEPGFNPFLLGGM
jgi:hypothetical protein